MAKRYGSEAGRSWRNIDLALTSATCAVYLWRPRLNTRPGRPQRPRGEYTAVC